MSSTTFVGLDAHKDSIFVAMLLPGRKTPILVVEQRRERVEAIAASTR